MNVSAAGGSAACSITLTAGANLPTGVIKDARAKRSRPVFPAEDAQHFRPYNRGT